MICENCGSTKESRVIDSRERKHYVYRIRQCEQCGFRYTTQEKYAGPVKKNQPRLLFLREAEGWNEAIWLEFRNGKFGATAISEITDEDVNFWNGMRLSRKTCLNEWRMWTRKPTEKQRMEEKWQ